MKSIFRAILVTAGLLFAVSCGKLLEPLYVHLPGTSWFYEQDGIRAYVHFGDDVNASVLQKTVTPGTVQQNNGSYVAGGHNVVVTCPDGTEFKFIRTFSHLKTKDSKNMSRYSPQSYNTVEGKVWAGLNAADLFICFFKDGENLVRAGFTVAQYEEGVPFGWKTETIPYTLNGSSFTAVGETGWLYSEMLFADGIWYTTYPTPDGSGASDLAGSVWVNRNGGDSSAGLIVFDSGYSFTRVQASNTGNQYRLERGTYTREGDVITMKMNGAQEDCSLSGNTFRFLGLTYGLSE